MGISDDLDLAPENTSVSREGQCFSWMVALSSFEMAGEAIPVEGRPSEHILAVCVSPSPGVSIAYPPTIPFGTPLRCGIWYGDDASRGAIGEWECIG